MGGKRIGLSVYLDFMSFDLIKQQLINASKLGYTDVFTSLQLHNLGFEHTKSIDETMYKALFKQCLQLGMQCHVDVNKEVFIAMGATIDNLAIFKEWGIPIIRLDGGFSDDEVVSLTHNPFNIMIEDNLSNAFELQDRLKKVSTQGNKTNYSGCHNFFPHIDTGLSLEFVFKTTQLFKSYNLQTGIFISSLHSSNDLYNQNKGVPTIEHHRYLPSYIQLLELVALDCFDFIMFGDSSPSDEELRSVASVFKASYQFVDKVCLTIPVSFEQGLRTDQLEYLMQTIHQNRCDQPELVIRSTITREQIMVSSNLPIHRPLGAITVDHQGCGRYAGELQIALKDLPPNASTTVIGYVKPYAKHLLKYLKEAHVVFKLVTFV